MITRQLSRIEGISASRRTSNDDGLNSSAAFAPRSSFAGETDASDQRAKQGADERTSAECSARYLFDEGFHCGERRRYRGGTLDSTLRTMRRSLRTIASAPLSLQRRSSPFTIAGSRCTENCLDDWITIATGGTGAAPGVELSPSLTCCGTEGDRIDAWLDGHGRFIWRRALIIPARWPLPDSAGSLSGGRTRFVI